MTSTLAGRLLSVPIFAYLSTYCVLRYQDVLIYDVTYRKGPDGVIRSGLGVRGNPGDDDSNSIQKLLGPRLETVLVPLCCLEDSIHNIIRRSRG